MSCLSGQSKKLNFFQRIIHLRLADKRVGVYRFIIIPVLGQILSSKRNSMSIREGLLMDMLFRAVLWIVVIVGGFILLGTVLGVSSGQIGGMIVVILFLGFIVTGLHLSLVLYKYAKKRDLLTASQI